jgi:photosystem II oxygen-evolving enhancer protein 1
MPVEHDITPESDALAALLLASNPEVAYQVPVQASARGKQSPKVTEGLSSKVLAGGLAGLLALTASTDSAVAGPFTRADLQGLTYDQVKGSGLANTCPKVSKGGSPSIKISGLKEINDFCLEPKSFAILEEQTTRDRGVEIVPMGAKVTTRQTYVLDGMSGTLSSSDGKLKFVETDGIDYAPTTIQKPGGERVPFLFSVKNLVATAGTSADAITPGFTMSGNFQVPSYRTGLFLDPKGRGTTTGYDQAVALMGMQAGGDEEMFKENDKRFDVGQGSIELKVTSVNSEAKEISGVFVQKQPSDTDLGGKEPKEVLMKGNWFATVE